MGKSSAYYNEFDPDTSAWLRELIADGLIADGEVDERSIVEVKPEDLRGFTQHHFFAGVGVWSYALRNAGWEDERPVWTGSCPCQPFSSAGKGKGIKDDRHLWPVFMNLIKQERPEYVFGEQVASSDVIGKVRQSYAGEDSTDWLDIVQADLEGAQYEFGAVVAPSAGVGAPHIRLRTWWMYHSCKQGLPLQLSQHCLSSEKEPTLQWEASERTSSSADRVANNPGQRRREARTTSFRSEEWTADASTTGTGGPTNGFWADVDWLWCRDEKWRPVEPGLEPLVNGSAQRLVQCCDQSSPISTQRSSEARAMRLKGYGNAINAEAARVFIECAMEVTNGKV